jgi:hypothetical protein
MRKETQFFDVTPMVHSPFIPVIGLGLRNDCDKYILKLTTIMFLVLSKVSVRFPELHSLKSKLSSQS